MEDSNLVADGVFWYCSVTLSVLAGGISLTLGRPTEVRSNVPQTPRWLMANDRHEDALAVMAKYHGEGDRNSPIVQLEYREMMEDISITGSDKRWWDYSELVNSKEARYRSMLVVAMGIPPLI